MASRSSIPTLEASHAVLVSFHTLSSQYHDQSDGESTPLMPWSILPHSLTEVLNVQPAASPLVFVAVHPDHANMCCELSLLASTTVTEASPG